MFESEKMKILILGGAGFIGSNLVKKFVSENYYVTVIDGLLDKTGGRKENIFESLNKITFINKRIEDIENLGEILSEQDVVIDSMGWTLHKAALSDPFFDMKLNVQSHLFLLQSLIKNKIFEKKIIYLGSKGQYGNPKVEIITEDTPLNPVDIQGIHKVASESYFKLYSKLYGLNVISLRIPNCFGENQIIDNKDIGLIGNFIRDALNGKIIEVYGETRKRSILYVDDLVDVVLKLSKKGFTGFNDYNISGCNKLIKYLAEEIVSIIGKGSV